MDLSRRDLLRLSLSASALAMIGGCGGSGSPGGSTSGRALWPPQVPTALGDGIESYSRSIDEVSRTFSGTNTYSDAIRDSLLGGSGGGGGGSTFGTRAPSGDYHIAAAILSYASLRANLERVNQSIYAAAKAGVVSSEVTTRFDLQGDSSLRNPHFQAALLRQLYASQRLILVTLEGHCRAGVSDFAAKIKNTSNSEERATLYALFAGGFNEWVSHHARVGKFSSSPLKIRVDAGFDPFNMALVAAEVDKAVQVSKTIKISFKAQPSNNREEDTSSEDSYGALDLVNDISGIFAGALTSWHQNPDYLVSIRSEIMESLYLSIQSGEGYSKLVARWLESTKNVEIVTKLPFWTKLPEALLTFVSQKLVEKIVETIFTNSGISPELTKCIIDLVGGGAGLVAAGVAGVTTSGVLVGLTAAQALIFINKVRECLPQIEELDQKARDAIKDFVVGVDSSNSRQVPAIANTSTAECDQIARAGLVRQSITADASKATANTNEAANRITDPSSDNRTSEQLANDALALILDYLQRNREVLDANIGGLNPNFFGNNDVGISRREPGATSGTLPLISEGEIMCTSPGKLPKRSPPGSSIDLTVMPSFPFLEPNTAISPGGSVIVR